MKASWYPDPQRIWLRALESHQERQVMSLTGDYPLPPAIILGASDRTRTCTE